MPEVKIPRELTPQYERIVKVLYDGDEARALQAAIDQFIHHELKRLPSGEKFEDLMDKRLKVESDKQGYANEKLSDAFGKIQERKKRLQSFNFGGEKEKEE